MTSPVTAVADVYRKEISDLAFENNILFEKNRQLEDQLCKTEKALSVEKLNELDMDSKNKCLEHEITNVTHLSDQLKREKDQLMAVSTEKLHQLEEKVVQNKQTQQILQDQNTADKKIRKQMEKKIEELEDQGAKSLMSNMELTQLLARLQEDKMRLSQRVEKLSGNERVLVLEIERLKRNGISKVNAVQTLVQGLESDRDYWKNEALLLKNSGLLSTIAKAKKDSNVTVNSAGKKLSTEPSSTVKRPIKPTSKKPVENGTTGSAETISQLKREREELKKLLNNLESKVVEIQNNLTIINTDKEKVTAAYKKQLKENESMRRDLKHAGKARSSSLARRVEVEREDAMDLLKSVSLEKQHLAEKCKLLQVELSNIGLDFERKATTIAEENKHLKVEKVMNEETIGKLKQRMNDLEQVCRSVRNEAETLQIKFSKKSEENDKYQLEKTSAEHQFMNVKKENYELENKYNIAHDHLIKVEEDASFLQKQLIVQVEENERVKTQLKRVEKDVLEKDDKLNQFAGQQHQMESDFFKMKAYIATLEETKDVQAKQNTQLTNQLQDAEQTKNTLELNLNRTRDELRSAHHKANETTAQNREVARQLQDVETRLMLVEKAAAELRMSESRLKTELNDSKNQSEDLARKNESQSKELRQNYQQIASLESEKSKLHCTADELSKSLQLKNESFAAQEKIISDLSITNSQLLAELSALKLTRDELKMQLSNTQSNCQLMEKQLEKLQCELNAARLETRSTTESLNHRLKENEELKLKRKHLEHEVDMARHEHSLLLDKYHKANEQRESLEKNLVIAKQQSAELERNVCEASAASSQMRVQMEERSSQLARVTTELDTKSAELSLLTGRIEDCQRNICEIRAKLDSKCEENRHLHADVHKMRQEATRLQHALNEKCLEFEKKREEVHLAAENLRSVDAQYTAKQAECGELAGELARLTNENAALNSRLERSALEADQLQRSIEEKSRELAVNDDQICVLNEKNAEKHALNQTLQNQNRDLQLGLGEREQAIRVEKLKCDQLDSKLIAAREIQSGLEKTNHMLKDELMARSLDLDQIKASMDDLLEENSVLRNDLEREKATNTDVESALKSTREKELDCQIQINELSSELNTVKDRDAMNSKKLDQMSTDYAQLQVEQHELERQVDFLRRSLSNERFEKEKAMSELRLHNMAPIYRRSNYLQEPRSCNETAALDPSEFANGEDDRDRSEPHRLN